MVPVPVVDRSYDVLIGDGAIDRLASAMAPSVRRAAVVTQPGVGVEVDTGREQKVFTIEKGEKAKRLETISELCRGFAQWGLTRSDAVVGVGGGVVTDVAGFAASVYHRGLPVVHVATTLLAQVDAAIGGKTGVNLPEGKNLVGTFWQPHAVICDTATLRTLPEREFRSGLGEVAKYHFLGAGNIDELPMPERVAACVRIKAEVVSADEKEAGFRAVLNYGHTLAHALEIELTFGLRHGEAVAVGLVYAAEVAYRLGRIGRAAVDEHRRVVEKYGLDWSLPSEADPVELLSLFGRDKKALEAVTMVLDGPRGVETVVDPGRELLIESMAALAS